MKIRNGFVSNSSSSSFVVEVFDWRSDRGKWPPKRAITRSQEMALKSYGFNAKESAILDGKVSRYDYEVICNQDEVIEFLNKNLIPFEARCHYGHETVISDGKKMMTIPNLGEYVATYKSSAMHMLTPEQKKQIAIENIPQPKPKKRKK